MKTEERQLRKALKRVPLKRRGFDSFLSPENMAQIALPHAVGRGLPLNRRPDLDDIVATYQAVAALAAWAVLLADGWDDPRSVREMRRGGKEIRRLSRSILVACDDRLATLDSEDD